MKSKAQIGAERAVLDQQVHGAATRAFHSAQRHELVKQGPVRDLLKIACAESGGHVYAPQTGKCKYCGVSNDTSRVANLGVLHGCGVGLSEWEPNPEESARIDFAISAAKREAMQSFVDRFAARRPSPAPQPSPDISSKGADALPAEDALSWFDRMRFVALYGRY